MKWKAKLQKGIPKELHDDAYTSVQNWANLNQSTVQQWQWPISTFDISKSPITKIFPGNHLNQGKPFNCFLLKAMQLYNIFISNNYSSCRWNKSEHLNIFFIQNKEQKCFEDLVRLRKYQQDRTNEWSH